ncbi:GreA/GreB family elongation factor [Caldimonas brevitalea]|uniref:Elongation factor GreAB n=1 Tax=Caldimonas brevitalea TaxID=413882 RepID=A0A0G3BMX2_9BURK|nr:GreA/GreB family elongation factor [Caldimonas brevitalea]AKJ30779.1 elongation factor GreAB [Caldimonas brevitalea]
MEVLTHEVRTLTELDHVRLERLIRGVGEPAAPQANGAMLAILDGAELVPSRRVLPDVVTMYSQVELADLTTGKRYRLTICYPPDAEPHAGFVSVLSPVGASLLGLRVGSIARWRLPGGEEGAAKVVALLFQPEACGDYTL